jgi:hypothetical protein
MNAADHCTLLHAGTSSTPFVFLRFEDSDVADRLFRDFVRSIRGRFDQRFVPI